MKGECAMKQSASNEPNTMRIPSLSHAPAPSRSASIAILPAVPVASGFSGSSCAQASAAAADTCAVISKRRTMNWVGRPLGSCGSSG